MPHSQSIGCRVESCRYQDNTECKCVLGSIEVEPCCDCNSGRAEDESMCGSYKCRD